jgi:alpha,alpha-trehalase
MDDHHLAALETTIHAEDWSGRVEVRSGIDGAVRNTGVARYGELSSRHLEDVAAAVVDDETVELQARTSHSRILVAEVARTRLYAHGRPVPGKRRVVRELDAIAQQFAHDLSEGESLTVEKTAALYTSCDREISNPAEAARRSIRRARPFGDLLQAHVTSWDHLWDRVGLTLVGAETSTFLVHLNVFHLLQTISENSVDLDVGVPARGLHGEGYHGHVFWDELFVFPFLTINLPELTRSLLRYRHRRLPEARQAAREAGYQGAMFPWQSGLDGREDTQTLHLNPRSRRWLPDNSHRQRHINIAVAYNFWQYYLATSDIQFLAFYGAEVVLEVARFWASIAEHDDARDRYVIRGVMGPDEYHDGYPDADEPGLDNNAYTNLMAVWVLCRALDVLAALSEQRRRALTGKLRLGRAEIERWEDISRRMLIPFHDGGIISQFEGYELLRELDWEGYRARYGDIQRLDRILEAEGDTTNRYKASKQADVLMLFFLLSSEELGDLLARLGYRLDPDTIQRTIEYYARRTSHGSTLSRVVHSWVLARSDRPGSYALFQEALRSDVADIQHGTTSEGIHLGAMAGTVDLVERGYAGLESRDGVLWINPTLPDEIRGLEFSFRWRRHWNVQFRIGDGRLRLSVPPSDAEPMTIAHAGRMIELRAGETYEAPLRAG